MRFVKMVRKICLETQFKFLQGELKLEILLWVVQLVQNSQKSHLFKGVVVVGHLMLSANEGDNMKSG